MTRRLLPALLLGLLVSGCADKTPTRKYGDRVVDKIGRHGMIVKYHGYPFNSGYPGHQLYQVQWDDGFKPETTIEQSNQLIEELK